MNPGYKYNEAIFETSIQHLGGFGKLRAMINARSFTTDEDGSGRFIFSGSERTNMLRIYLVDDLYTLEFYMWKGPSSNPVQVKKYSNVFVDDLPRMFESYTGLYLRL